MGLVMVGSCGGERGVIVNLERSPRGSQFRAIGKKSLFSLEKSLRANSATTRFRRRKSFFCVALPTRIKDLQQKVAVFGQYATTFQGKTRDLLHLLAS